jgi:hypothetical protein
LGGGGEGGGEIQPTNLVCMWPTFEPPNHKTTCLHIIVNSLRGTLEEGPRRKVQQNGAILSIESYKLDPSLLDKDSKAIQANLRQHLHDII